MSNSEVSSRGPYAVGVEKREKILAAALEVIATQGYQRASVREIADAAGVSPAGLMHYFGTKDDLFVAILAARDASDTKSYGSATFGASAFLESFFQVMRHNMSVPGLVRLYTQLLAEAADREHPAHAFFTERSRLFDGAGHEAIVQMQNEGFIRADLNPAWIARIVHASADGLQAAWLLDPGLDMVADLEELMRVLAPAEGSIPPRGSDR